MRLTPAPPSPQELQVQLTRAGLVSPAAMLAALPECGAVLGGLTSLTSLQLTGLWDGLVPEVRRGRPHARRARGGHSSPGRVVIAAMRGAVLVMIARARHAPDGRAVPLLKGTLRHAAPAG